MVAENPISGRNLDGRLCGIGNKEGFVKTNIEFALKDPDIAEEMVTAIGTIEDDSFVKLVREETENFKAAVTEMKKTNILERETNEFNR